MSDLKYINENSDSASILLSEIMHELGNPLTFIYSTIQLLSKHHPELYDDPLWPQLLKDFDDLKKLNKSLAEYSSFNKLSYDSVNIKKLLTELYAAWKPNAIQNQRQFILSVPPQDLLIHCDPLRIKQCIVNLIKNSFEATTMNDSIFLSLKYHKDYITISISDLGCGIASENIDHIFDMFSTSKSEGSGIGLALTKRIIEAHHGQISVHSKINRGTVFTITLPIHQEY